jgi:hypothetical protein
MDMSESTDVTAVMLPSRDWPGRAEVAAEVVALGTRVHVPPEVALPEGLPPAVADSRTVASLAMGLNAAAIPGPIVVVSNGQTSRLLPALALAQRAVHRQVRGYVLVDSPVPSPGPHWPDAPVWWCCTNAAPESVVGAELTARLRGFHVGVDADVAATIVTASD